MHHHATDDLSFADSPIHRLPAAIKLILAVGTIIAAVTVPAGHPLFFAGVAAALLAVAAVAKLPPLFVIKRLAMLEPLVLGVACLSLLGPGGPAAFGMLVLRSTLCLLTIIVLANTTPFSRLLAVLHRLGVPSLMITTLALMNRYLFVLLDESRRMRRAQACRTFTPNRRRAWGDLAGLIGQLFVRSVDRAERVYAAMCARGWR